MWRGKVAGLSRRRGARTIAEAEAQLLARPPCRWQGQGHALAWARRGLHWASLAWRGSYGAVAWRGYGLAGPRGEAQGLVSVPEGGGASAQAQGLVSVPEGATPGLTGASQARGSHCVYGGAWREGAGGHGVPCC